MHARTLACAAALALCACQYVADLRESDVSPRDADVDAADLDADAPDRDADADTPRDPDADAEGDPAPDPDVPDVPDLPDDDGGVTGCTGNAQCDDLKVCTGDETCNLATGTCIPGANRPAGYDCDDADPCTSESSCNGDGACVGMGNACYDGRSCTTDVCTVTGPTTRDCSNTIIDGYCLIASECFTHAQDDPSNECQFCDANDAPTDWTSHSNLEPCAGGLCCGGMCRPGAGCCLDSDCPSGCRGTPASCGTFTNETECAAQQGCDWHGDGGPCMGTAAGCDMLDPIHCATQQGCDYMTGSCADFGCT